MPARRRVSVELGLAALITGSPFVAAADRAPIESSATQVEAAAIDHAEIARAKLFDLSAKDWSRYRTLMQGPRGLWSPTLDPVWVLGIHAESEAERARFAELAARHEHERVAAELAFARAYAQAFERLYPGEPVMDVGRLTPERASSAEAAGFTPGERLLFFASPECPACESWLEALLPRLGPLDLGLDIYLLDARSDEAVRRWAGAHHIPPDWVRERRVTLNHDSGLLAKLSHEAHPPVLLRRQGTAVAPVSLLDLIAARAADAR